MSNAARRCERQDRDRRQAERLRNMWSARRGRVCVLCPAVCASTDTNGQTALLMCGRMQPEHSCLISCEISRRVSCPAASACLTPFASLWSGSAAANKYGKPNRGALVCHDRQYSELWNWRCIFICEEKGTSQHWNLFVFFVCRAKNTEATIKMSFAVTVSAACVFYVQAVPAWSFRKEDNLSGCTSKMADC